MRNICKKKRRRIDPQKMYIQPLHNQNRFILFCGMQLFFFNTTLNSPAFSVNLKVHRWMHAHNEC